MNKCVKILIFFLILPTNLTPSEIYEHAEKLQNYYHNDLASTFANMNVSPF